MQDQDKREFKGTRKQIAPNRLINQKKEDKVEEFFLTLAVIFNDLKGLVLFNQLIQSGYRRPAENEVTVHAGEYGGVLIQIHKLFAASINEFFKFLEENTDVLATGEFTQVLQNIPAYRKEQWKAITDVALGKATETSDFANALLQIRNNMSFHYYQSGKNLRKGFINRFFSNNKKPHNEFAFYSLGDTLEETRFYFGDAAVEQYLFMTSHKLSGEGHDQEIAFNKEYIQLINGVIDKMNMAIHALMKAYLPLRPYLSAQ